MTIKSLLDAAMATVAAFFRVLMLPSLLVLLTEVANAQNTLLPSVGETSQASQQSAPQPAASEGGLVKLRQSARQPDESGELSEQREQTSPYMPSEFERFVNRLADRDVRRLGSELVLASNGRPAAEWSNAIPPEYVVSPGDEVLLVLWGSVDADLRLNVDRAGRITVPRVGSVQVGGIRYDQLTSVVEKRVAQIFRNFQLSVTLGRLRGIRVFVTGHVLKPGTYNVSPLSTVLGAVMQAGGPSPSGSYRKIELKRGARPVARVDLYDLLFKGDNSADRMLQAGDVVHVDPIGLQVGVIGSVNKPAVVELTETEGVAEALTLAGGFAALADRSRLSIERLRDRVDQGTMELILPRDAKLSLDSGDVLRAFSAAEARASTQRQNKRVRVDGEVARPGEYLLPPNSSLQDALRIAGGLSDKAFVYGTQFSRASVRATQQENYERALRDLETDFARSTASQRVSSSDQAAQTQAQSAATTRLVARLRALKPNGRVVLQLTPGSRELPQLLVEDGDHLYIPPKPTTVGVFGSVFNAGSYLYSDGRAIEDYLRLAGGPTKGADDGSIFVVRSNGQVISGRQSASDFWFASRNKLGQLPAEPGDTVFVPEEIDKTTFLQAAKDWTQILYQFGIGIAGISNALR